MLIIPELKRVIITPPRTGSATLRTAVLNTFPRAFMLYRHMEADGVPLGYDHWQRVCVIRDPVDRMWSLYKYLKDFDGGSFNGPADSLYVDAMQQSVNRSFCSWLVENSSVFTSPISMRGGYESYAPFFTVRHPMPETRKSQWHYARPDLGVGLVYYGLLEEFATELGILPHVWDAARQHVTSKEPRPELTMKAYNHMQTFHSWDMLLFNRGDA